MNYTIVKTQCELYKIRKENTSSYWADITLDYSGKSGRIQIASDFGNWQYFWGACGSSFKEFLTKLDIHYTASKFGCDSYFDIAATEKSWYEEIKENRKCQYITAEQAKLICEEAQSILNESCHESAYKHLVYNSSILMSFIEEPCCIPFETTISPLFRRFWDEVWKEFIEYLKTEND